MADLDTIEARGARENNLRAVLVEGDVAGLRASGTVTGRHFAPTAS